VAAKAEAKAKAKANEKMLLKATNNNPEGIKHY